MERQAGAEDPRGPLSLAPAPVAPEIGLALGSVAQAQGLPEPRNVVQLSASAQQEAVQDWLTVTLQARHQAPDAGTVQNQLKVALDAALAVAKSAAVRAAAGRPSSGQMGSQVNTSPERSRSK